MSHALKNFAFKSTNSRSALRIVREAELNGGVLSASLSKEHLLLTAEFLKGDEDYFAELLAEVVSSTKYCKYEYSEEVIPSIVADVEQASQDPVVRGLESLLATAYRNSGVGASLFVNPAAPVSVDAVRSFAGQALNRANLAVVGSGLNQQALQSLVEEHFSEVPAGEALKPTESKYYGGDFRAPITDSHGHPLPQDHFFLAFEGASRSKGPEVAVLEALLGGEPSVKWSHGASPLARIRQQVEGARAHSFSASFQSTGILGLHVAAPTGKVTDAAKLAVEALKNVASGAPAAEELSRAKANAKFAAASQLEGSRIASHETGAALLLDGAKVSVEEQLAALEGVSATDVSTLAESLLKSKPTAAALGAVKQLPYADELL